MGTDAATSGSPLAALDPSSQTPYRDKHTEKMQRVLESAGIRDVCVCVSVLTRGGKKKKGRDRNEGWRWALNTHIFLH